MLLGFVLQTHVYNLVDQLVVLTILQKIAKLFTAGAWQTWKEVILS